MTPSVGAGSATVVLRDGLVVYASHGMSGLLGRLADELVGQPFLLHVAPEDQERLSDRYARRLRGEPVPSEYELKLVTRTGEHRAVEAQVSLEGRDEVVVRLRDLSGETLRRSRLAGLAELGVAIQRERTEAAIFERVREGLSALGLDSALMRAEQDGVRVLWLRLQPALAAEVERLTGHPTRSLAGPWTSFNRTAWSEGVSYTDDWSLSVADFLPPGSRLEARRLAARAGASRALAVRLDERGGATRYLTAVGDWLGLGDAAAVRLFGSQVAAALDSAQAFAELSGRNFDLAALNRLGELTGGTVGLGELLPEAGEVVCRTVGCDALAIYSADSASRTLTLIHSSGAPADLSTAFGQVPFESPLGAVVLQRRLKVMQSEAQAPAARAWLERAGMATVAYVPLVIRSRVLGAMVIGWRAARSEEACRTNLLLAMGSHFAATIEAHELLGDLRRRVAELTLLNDVASATASLDPVLLLENALGRIGETFGCEGGAAFLVEDGGLALKASFHLSAASRAELARLELSENPAGLAIDRRLPVPEAAPAQRGPRVRAVEARERFEVVAAVPLLAARPVGVLLLWRRQPRGFDAGDLSLLSTVGVQVGVGVDAARQHADTQRRARDLEAVHALALRVFGSAPGDAGQMLLEACAEVARAFGAPQAAIALLDGEGHALRTVASHGAASGPDPLEVPLARAGLAREALARRLPLATADTSRDPGGGLPGGGPDAPGVSLLAVPLAARDRNRGVILVTDLAGRRFGDADLALATALGGELALAVENAELFAEARRRAEEMSLVQDVGRSLVETLELQHVLDAGVRNLARIVAAPDAYLLLLDEAGTGLEIRAVAGARPDLLGRRVALHGEASLSAASLLARQPIAVDDFLRDRVYLSALRGATGARAGLALPLLVRERAIGAAVILETSGPRHFEPAEIERAAAIANQLAIAVDNARTHARALSAYDDLHRANERNLRQERLAALGELAAVVAHEVRNPLGVIFNSIGSLRRLIRPEGDARLLLDILGEESDRLNHIVGDLLDFAHPSAPQLLPERLERVVDDAVGAALAQPPVGVELVRELDPPLPSVPLDARLVRQAVLNLAVNAVQAMPRGGRLTVRLRAEPLAAVVEIEDTGHGIPDEVRERIFEPFFTTKATGTGLGLAVVKRIVDGHGGEIKVRSRPGAGTVFSLRFPLPPAA
jgi:PAS domain S-box-containing protein